MGGCFSAIKISTHVRHKSQISKELERDAKTEKHKYKILILGPKRSGKSTIFNQLKFIHNGYIASERQQSKLAIITYIIQSLQTIIECIEEYEKHKQFTIHRFTLNTESKQSADYIKNLDKKHNMIDETIAYHIEILSKQTAIRKIIKDADKYYIDISIRYFLKHFNRIKDINYIPTDSDIIQLRIKTDAFNEQTITIRYPFAVYDIDYKPDICNVNKYMHYFENVTAIIFVASMCAFDEQIFEDNKSYQEQLEWKQAMELMESYVGNDILNIVLEFIGHPKNVMQQSFELFENVCNNVWFKKTAIILFLSKSDLFAAKIDEYKKIDNDIDIPFMQCFPEYIDGIKYDECSDYIKNKFVELNDKESREIYTHFVNGTDITLMTRIFNDVQHVIISAALANAGLL